MDDSESTTRFHVVVNSEQQYSIWPVEFDIPDGWKRAKKTGTNSECLAFVDQVWTDMRPLSVRRAMAEPARSGGMELDADARDLSGKRADACDNLLDAARSVRRFEHRPSFTVERFIPDPFSRQPGSSLYQTGDRAGSLPDERLDFVGRPDDRVKRRGYRIDLKKIELALLQHQHVHRALVLRHGAAGRTKLVAYCVADGGDHSAELRRFLSDRLPGYMIPSEIVTIERFPLMPNGKIDRRALRKINTNATTDKVRLRNELELSLLELWREALGNNTIGVNDNFFEFGGHSLLAMRLLGTIEDRLGESMPLSSLFSHGSVAEFADALEHSSIQQFGAECFMLNHAQHGTPVVLVGGLLGELGRLKTLAKHLPADLPVYGLRLRGDRFHAENCNRLEDLAQIFIAALKAKLPRRSYRFIGYSFGALTAFEIARQLAAAGEPASPVVAIDSGPRGPARGLTDLLLRDVPSMIRNLPRWLGSEEVTDALYRLGIGVQKRLNPRSDYNPESLRLELADAVLRKRELRKIPRNYRRRALQGLEFERTYDPPSHNGRIVVIRTKVRPLFHQARPDLGWGRVATPVEVHTTTGVHGTVFQPQHIARLANTVQQAILAET